MKIEYPSEEEINRSIAESIAKAYPKREGLLIYLSRLYRHIGMDFLLHGMREMLLSVLAAYFFLIICYNSLSQTVMSHSCLLIVLFSPLVFQLILFLSVVMEQEQSTLELQMTCKYTIYHILALRMLLVSAFSVLLNSAACIVVFWESGAEMIVRMIFLSTTVLFAYSLFYVKLLTRSVRLTFQVLLYGVWIAANIMLCLLLPAVYRYMVWELPLVFHIGMWLLSAVLMGYLLSRFLYRNCQYNLYVGDGIC